MKRENLSATTDKMRTNDDVLAKFLNTTVLVVGDLMLDEAHWGHIRRISPEAPVPILNLEHSSCSLGGAANAAKNLRALGAQLLILGVVGEDDTGDEILESLDHIGASRDGVLRDSSRRSSRKTRLISIEHGQQVFRMDQESTHPISEALESSLLARLEAVLPQVDAILCSDYLKGVLTERVLQETFRLARSYKVRVVVAPKDSNASKYRGASILVPNTIELARLAGESIDDDGWLSRAASKLFQEWTIDALLVTRGKDGMSLFERRPKDIHRVDIPTMAQSVYDVTGAGDTAVSVFTLAEAAGASRETAVRLANLAAGIVVGKQGAATVTIAEIRERMLELPVKTQFSRPALTPLNSAALSDPREAGMAAND
jgi:rfaE bifunctional protein kinase chain/domain